MSMEMAWHFDGEKAKLQVLISHLNSLPCMRTGARAGEQQVGSGPMELRPGLHLSG